MFPEKVSCAHGQLFNRLSANRFLIWELEMAKYKFENFIELKNCPEKALCPIAFVNDATISFFNTGF